jgi:hypothetical protein
MIKSRKIIWAVYVTCMGDRKVHTGCWWGNLRDRVNLGRHRHRWKDNIRTCVKEI